MSTKLTHISVAEEVVTLRVTDDFPCDIPVTPSELDAVEAFLMGALNELLAGDDHKISPPKEAARL
ncbi:hypothetical protein GCM10007874_50730 [Labrys miyagiensis]|uniref:DUF1902 domain-containing protein n=1 Tax=Labrys miyagiensis TaxID=346912 RepID=A0ABQ6CUX0_9HYPH|nr:hypothetical protein [Labrys miyagiensis]GLS22056.1 hypothetical protein GCM10007874_50730 [Labrys miyagiensis]